VLLGVIQAGERTTLREREPVEVEQHGGCHEGTREGAAAGLVGSRDEAALEGTVESEELPAGRLLLRACRCDSAASR
jgi:hypothetical protein